jgi:UDP-N-acetylglucosamine 2-epimerase (non-hydrolysing)
MTRKKLFFIFGTRPEAIKLAPLIHLTRQDLNFETIVCTTGQHRQMLDQVLNFFKITPDYDLSLMKPNQDLFSITSDGLEKLKPIIQDVKPDYVLVQGDTATAFIGALAGFYNKTKIAHIEAGLRSGDKYSPYPEEVYRKLVGNIADFHFAPTLKAAENLNKENIAENVYVTGNTVIDALLLGLEIIKSSNEQEYYKYFDFLDFNKKIILITCHRRESFGKPLEEICKSLKKIAAKYPDVQLVYPVHLNPNVKQTVEKYLSKIDNIFLIEPLDYRLIIWLMEKSYMIITDSGGIQEEAPSLGKPVLVTRDVTERTEGIEAGGAVLVGTKEANIVRDVESLLTDKKRYESMSTAQNPYGDGKASRYIMDILKKN